MAAPTAARRARRLRRSSVTCFARSAGVRRSSRPRRPTTHSGANSRRSTLASAAPTKHKTGRSRLDRRRGYPYSSYLDTAMRTRPAATAAFAATPLKTIRSVDSQRCLFTAMRRSVAAPAAFAATPPGDQKDFRMNVERVRCGRRGGWAVDCASLRLPDLPRRPGEDTRRSSRYASGRAAARRLRGRTPPWLPNATRHRAWTESARGAAGQQDK